MGHPVRVALTMGLGRFVSNLRYENLPEPVVQSIRTGFTDCVGVMLAGASEPAAQLLKSMLRPAGGEATVLYGESRACAQDAAWINGTAAHALDFDDVDGALRGHPSTVLVPAILAEAEAIGASGRQMVVAYAAGHQVWADLARRDAELHHNKGWHPTGIFGAIAGAAACASLRGLDAGKSAIAIALGASQSAGLVSNLGTMTKPFHAGRAAHAAIVSGRLAASGFTAALDALERHPGFLAAVSPSGRIDIDAPVRAGVDWNSRFTVKKYPVCFCSHRALDGILDLRKAHRIEVDSVLRISVTTSRRNATFLHYHCPRTALEAKFSMEFAMASALVAGRAGLAELSDRFVGRADIQALMKRVTVIPDDREDPVLLGYAIHDQVIVETHDGRRLDSGPITRVRGDPDLPLDRAELWVKFEECAATHPIRVRARELFESLMSLEKVRRIEELPGLGGRDGHAH
jgi:2-methylcitrate dehydratase PrpD